MKYILLIFLAYSISYSKDFSILSKETSLYLLNEVKYGAIDFTIKSINDDIYLFKSEPMKDSLGLYLELNEIKSQRENKIRIPVGLADVRNYFPDFHLEKKYLYLLEFDYIFKYEVNKNDFVFLEKIQIPSSCLSFRKENNTIVTLAYSLQSAQKNGNVFNYFNIYDIDKREWKSIHLPLAKGQKWTQINLRQNIDYSQNQFAIADMTRYNINIYDENGTLLANLTRDIDGWNDRKIINTISEDASDKNDLMIMFEKYKEIFLLNYLKFIDSNTLLVSYHIPNTEDMSERYPLRFDIWKRKNDSWKMIHTDLNNFGYHKDSLFSISNREIKSNFRIEDRYLYQFENIPFEISEEHEKLTNEEFIIKIEEYLYENDLKISVLLRKLRF